MHKIICNILAKQFRIEREKRTRQCIMILMNPLSNCKWSFWWKSEDIWWLFFFLLAQKIIFKRQIKKKKKKEEFFHARGLKPKKFQNCGP